MKQRNTHAQAQGRGTKTHRVGGERNGGEGEEKEVGEGEGENT